ncbi:MAG: hypothetical protein AB8I08_37865 [Sandaracinaceae bacterium]
MARVDILQEGTEDSDSSGGWSHRWTEKNRRIWVRPFEMELDASSNDAAPTRIRVEPTKQVVLADDLDGVVRVNVAERVLRAQLVPGERLIACGHLERRAAPSGYRGATATWVMVSPKTAGVPFLLSTQPLGARMRKRASNAGAAAVLVSLGLLGLQVPAVGFHARTWSGRTVHGEYVGRQDWQTRNGEGDLRDHHSHTVRLPDGSTFTSVDGYVPSSGADVRVVPWAPMFNALGHGPSAHMGLLFLFPAAVVFSLLAGGVLLVTGERRWYEGEAVVHRGSGRLK